MTKKAYIIEEIEQNGFTMDTKVYSSKARAIKAFTKEVNHRIASDYFKNADDKEFFEVEKKLKELNEWFNVHTTHHIIVTRPYNEKKWWVCCSRNQPSLLSLMMYPKGQVNVYTFNSWSIVAVNTIQWNQFTLTEVELQ